MSLGHFQLRKNVIHAVVAFGLNIALVFISYRLVILQGGVKSLGVWSTLMAWIYLIRLGDVGMGSATTRFVATCDIASDFEKIRTYIDTGLIANASLYLCLSLVGYLLMTAQIDFLLPINTEKEVVEVALEILPAMFISFLLMNISGLVLGCLQGLHLGFFASRVSVAGSVLQLIAVVVLVPYFGLLGMAWALVIQHAFVVIFGWLLIWKNFRGGAIFPKCISRVALKEMLSYSIKVQTVNLINGAFEPVSKILISRFGGLEVQGLYELAYKTVSLPRNVIVSGSAATIPAMTNLFINDREELRELYKKIFRFVMVAVLFVLLVVVLASPLISYVWMGRVDKTYCLFVALIVFGFIGNVYGAPAYNFGLASGEIKYNLYAAIFALVSMLSGAVLLGWGYGPTGVVSAVAFGLIAGGVSVKIMNELVIFKS